MNGPIRRLFLFLAILFVALIAMSTYWLWRSPDLEARQGNPTLVVRQLTIQRGLIYASDGRTVLARNRKREVQGKTLYERVYPTRGLLAQTVGYSTVARSRAGLEKSMNDYLTGSNSNLSTVIDRTLDRLRGLTQQGNSLVLTVDADAQAEALRLLEPYCGSVVALEPATGRVLVLASSPTYDPNLVEKDFEQVLTETGPCRPAAPLLNRGTAGLYIPGSTFKVITAAAALDTGRYELDSEFVDEGYCLEYGKKVFNFADQSGPQVFGRVTLAEALANSINAVFCDIGKELGPLTVLEYAKRFGFYELPPLETPSDERRVSGLYRRGQLFEPTDPNDVDPGRLAFGQERLLATPLQMAMVAAGVANGGVVMVPRVVDRILEPDGAILTKTEAKVLSEAVEPQTATELAAIMELAVESGTGTAAQIPGVRVAGKTGTAETGRRGENDVWFIGFAPVEAPTVAIAVALSDQAGTGGALAAPIARAIMETLLSRST
jgi:peptidoglycan glycosyltransferase